MEMGKNFLLLKALFTYHIYAIQDGNIGVITIINVSWNTEKIQLSNVEHIFLIILSHFPTIEL